MAEQVCVGVYADGNFKVFSSEVALGVNIWLTGREPVRSAMVAVDEVKPYLTSVGRQHLGALGLMVQ